ncbi:NAD kinase 2, mitochondrial isoform X4 [Kryptolebias marmoratus]|uniref:NAD kinase 2, mitochondrial isoform X4 n=1 Tax=Kryptolebias marmoratus TaxID=37003 RepID=UPI0007F93B83|nr:NAD kinase 2, mitochondrial isoform X4 [Kryptolebias marmoratus]
MARRFAVNLLRFGSRTFSCGSASLRPLHTAAAGRTSSEPTTGFKPGRVAVVTKTTRYEFEQQRYRYAGLSEDDLKQLLAMKGSSYSGLLERHNIHTNNVEHVVRSLQREGIEVRVVKRGEYNEEVVRWADAIISAGGDGTMLLVASKVLSKDKPVFGVNTDPERWLWRQRIRLHLEGTGINPSPVDLHELQLSLEQHSQAHRIRTVDGQQRPGSLHQTVSEPTLLPVRSLNEVFIGESLSSRASYYEISVDDGPWEKQKSSGLSICTGTGSKAWSYNINKLSEQSVEEVLQIGASEAGLDFPLNRDFVGNVTDRYNESLVFGPDERRLFFSVREPIVNRVFSCSRQRGFASRVCVRSRCWDACMVVDGGTSFEFNDGAIATISTSEEDQLRTVLLGN